MIIFLALGAVGILFLPARNGQAYYWQEKLFSPGQIAIKHTRDLEGRKILCQDCHRAGQAMSNSSCTGCHNEKFFRERTPYLAAAHQIFDRQDNCLRCHGEHRGPYMARQLPGLTPQMHRQFRVKTGNCPDCHRELGVKAHFSLARTDCQGCHKNYSWASDYEHRVYLTKAKSPAEMLSLCQECHKPAHHYNYSTGEDTQEFCLFCHDYWAKRRERKTIPFPEELFKDVKVDPKKFTFKK